MTGRYQAHRAPEPAMDRLGLVMAGIAIALLGWAFLAGVLTIGAPS